METEEIVIYMYNVANFWKLLFIRIRKYVRIGNLSIQFISIKKFHVASFLVLPFVSSLHVKIELYYKYN